MSAQEIARPDWMTVGAQVIEFAYADHGFAEQTVIERFTATMVILTNGHRFKISSTPQRRAGDRTYTFLPATHDRAQRKLSQHRLLQRRIRLQDAYNDWNRTPGSIETTDRLARQAELYRDQLQRHIKEHG